MGAVERARARLIETVLLVEDNAELLRAWARVVRNRGRSALLANASSEALDQAKLQTPDLVLVDLFLGREDGLALVGALRPLCPNAHIVLASACMTMAYAVAGIRAGADDAIVKPYTARQLELLIESAELRTRYCPDAEDLSLSSLEHAEWEHITRVLEHHQNNITRAARTLGIPR